MKKIVYVVPKVKFVRTTGESLMAASGPKIGIEIADTRELPVDTTPHDDPCAKESNYWDNSVGTTIWDD